MGPNPQARAKPDLNLVKGCCERQAGLKGYISPFSRAVALEYGDGNYQGRDAIPVAGVAQCGSCRDNWLFALVAHRGEVAAYLLRPAPPESLDRLVAAYAAVKRPRWPVWVPPSELRAEHLGRAAEAENNIWEHAGAPVLVVAVKNLITGRVLGATPWRPGVRPERWFELLEL